MEVKKLNDIYINIINDVTSKLNRNISINEKKQISNFVKNINVDLWKPSIREKTKKIMVETLVKEFKSYDCTIVKNNDPLDYIRNDIGTSEESDTSHGIYDNPSFMVSEQYPENKIIQNIENEPVENPVYSSEQTSVITNLLGATHISEAVSILNPKSRHKRNHILLDSRYRISTDQSPVNIKEFEWGYVQKSVNTTEGSVNIIGNVRDIIGFRIHKVRIPYTASADNKYQKISILIKEYSAQSFIAHENRKFHFMMNSVIDSDFITLEADVYDGFFWFEKALTAVDKLTITFGNPLEPIVFDRDRDYCVFDYFILAPNTQVTTRLPHNLQNGDRVYFSEFDVGAVNPLLINQKIINDSIKNQINSTSGYLITVINSTTFSIPVNSSQIQNPLTTINTKVFYGSKRFLIPLEIIYIQPASGE